MTSAILTDNPSANLTQMYAKSGWETVLQLPRKKRKFPSPQPDRGEYSRAKNVQSVLITTEGSISSGHDVSAQMVVWTLL